MNKRTDCPCSGKNLDRFLQPHILKILSGRDLYGFEIIRLLEKETMFLNNPPDPTGVYRYLKKMEESGLLSSCEQKNGDDRKILRVYTLTENGKNCLETWAVVLGQYAVDIMGVVADIENLTADH